MKIKTALEFLKENIEETNIPEEHWENEIAEMMEWYAEYYHDQQIEKNRTTWKASPEDHELILKNTTL